MEGCKIQNERGLQGGQEAGSISRVGAVKARSRQKSKMEDKNLDFILNNKDWNLRKKIWAKLRAFMFEGKEQKGKSTHLVS